MRTHLGGTIIEKSAMAEVAILQLSDFTVGLLASGIGNEILEQLDVPIGNHPLSPTEVRDVGRACGGQHASDPPLDHLGSACQNWT